MEIVTICSALIGVASFVYAIKEKQAKKRFEKLVQHKLAGIAGNVWYAEKSADMSDHNFTRTRDELLKLAGGATNQLVLKHIHNGARDSVAAKRMLSNLLGEVISMQKGMFGTERIMHPEWTEEQLLPHNPKEIP